MLLTRHADAPLALLLPLTPAKDLYSQHCAERLYWVPIMTLPFSKTAFTSTHGHVWSDVCSCYQITLRKHVDVHTWSPKEKTGILEGQLTSTNLPLS